MDNTNQQIVRKGRGRVRVVITSLEGDILKYGVQLQFLTTNNEAEYEAVLTGLKLAKSMEAKNVLLKRGLWSEGKKDVKVLEADEPTC